MSFREDEEEQEHEISRGKKIPDVSFYYLFALWWLTRDNFTGLD